MEVPWYFLMDYYAPWQIVWCFSLQLHLFDQHWATLKMMVFLLRHSFMFLCMFFPVLRQLRCVETGRNKFYGSRPKQDICWLFSRTGPWDKVWQQNPVFTPLTVFPEKRVTKVTLEALRRKLPVHFRRALVRSEESREASGIIKGIAGGIMAGIRGTGT